MKEEGLLLRCILGVLFKGLLQGNSPHPTIAEQNVQRPEQRRPPAPVRLSSAVGPNAAHTADAGDQDPQPPGASAAAVIPGGGPSTAPASAPAAGQGGVWCVSVGRRSQGTVSGSHCAASFQFRPYGCKSHYRNGAGNACASRQGALSSVFAVDCRRRGRKGRGRRRRTLPGQKGLRRQRGPLRPGGGGAEARATKGVATVVCLPKQVFAANGVLDGCRLELCNAKGRNVGRSVSTFPRWFLLAFPLQVHNYGES